jgi:hypothetical protein
MLTHEQAQWLAHDGAAVTINRHPHRLRVEQYEAISPYHHSTLRVFAVPQDTGSPYYHQQKAQLGDDWVIDVYYGSEALRVSVMRQVGMTCLP